MIFANLISVMVLSLQVCVNYTPMNTGAIQVDRWQKWDLEVVTFSRVTATSWIVSFHQRIRQRTAELPSQQRIADSNIFIL